MKTIATNVTDSNGIELGFMLINIKTNSLNQPEIVEHKGVKFYATGKVGASRTSGLLTFEMASSEYDRILVDRLGLNLLED
jgi:hypothetical protein